MPAYCPLCASDERTSEGNADDGRHFASCAHPDHGPEPFTWELYTPGTDRSTRGDGLGAELGIWDKLLECLEPGEPAIAYGILEDRFLERFPVEWKQLIDRYGHRWRYPDKRSGQYSASVYLAARLRELADDTAVELTWAPATGEWAYNGVISQWRRP